MQKKKQIADRSRGNVPGDNSAFAVAKPFISKATFGIDNVSVNVIAVMMAKFVAAMVVDVLGCYDAEP